MTLTQAIQTVVARQDLSIAASREVFTEIMTGNASAAQIAALITALRMKGETADEITGAAEVMREKAMHVPVKDDTHLIDTCGTGGDGSNTFNISTAAAFVAAGAGAVVAKHGNRSVSSASGSADVLESLGVTISVSAEIARQCLDNAGICFLFAPAYHSAMKHAIGPRKEIAIRTIFNILGPLSNPTLARRQLLGVYEPRLTGLIAAALSNTGSIRAFVVHGLDPLDELSISGPTQVTEVSDGSLRTYQITPEEFGLTRAPLDEIRGGSASENATIIRDILEGRRRDAARSVVVLNAGFAITAAGLAKSPAEGIVLAQRSIDSGNAMQRLETLIRVSAQ